MKRKLGTLVLFVLLILTVVALVKLDHAEALNDKQSKAPDSAYGTY